MGDDGKSLRKWCFTINNYIEEDEQNLLDELTPDKVVYAIVGREKGESGTPHLQGYVCFKRRLKMNTATATLGKTARLEPARGTPEQNEQYCSKDGDILLKIGEPSLDSGKKTANRRDYWAHEIAHKMSKTGMTIDEVVDQVETNHDDYRGAMYFNVINRVGRHFHLMHFVVVWTQCWNQ